MADTEVTVVTDDATADQPVDTGDTVVISGGGGSDDALVGIAATVGMIAERQAQQDERLAAIESRLPVVEATADAAITIADEAVTEAAAATDEAVMEAVAAAEEAVEPDMEPEREHWFFKPAPWKRNHS